MLASWCGDILAPIQQVKPIQSDPLGEANFGSRDARKELLEKIASSTTFRKSNRLRELLLYLGDRSLLESNAPIHEQELGIQVFERPADYDTSQDPIVRVQMSQLRKRLELYFTEEGWDEPLTIEIPRGSYTLQFRARSVLEQVAIVEPRRRHIAAYILGAVALVLLMVTIALAWQNMRLRQQVELGLGPHPTVTRLWQQMFGNGLETYIALADGTLVVFEDQVSQQISVQNYENKNFGELAQQRISNPAVRELVMNLLGWSFTGLGDANLARRLGLLSSSIGIPMDVVLARSLSTQQVSRQNTILFGSRRADPWISLFEDQLNFQTVFEESPRTASFQNRKPQPGEQSTYPGEWSKLAYCRVAYLANPKGTGSTLLISGTSMASTEAGGEFITSEKALQQLRSQQNLSSGDPFPHFEVLLKVKIVNNAISQYGVVAWRLH